MNDQYVVLAKRIKGTNKQIRKFEHRKIWEDAHGQIPKGYQIHHINGNKKDNRLENLTLLTPEVHTRLERGWLLRTDGWYRICSFCRRLLKADEINFYRHKKDRAHAGEFLSKCRDCYRTTRAKKC